MVEYLRLETKCLWLFLFRLWQCHVEDAVQKFKKCLFVCMCLRVCACMDACVCACMDACVCVLAWMRVCVVYMGVHACVCVVPYWKHWLVAFTVPYRRHTTTQHYTGFPWIRNRWHTHSHTVAHTQRQTAQVHTVSHTHTHSRTHTHTESHTHTHTHRGRPQVHTHRGRLHKYTVTHNTQSHTCTHMLTKPHKWVPVFLLCTVTKQSTVLH